MPPAVICDSVNIAAGTDHPCRPQIGADFGHEFMGKRSTKLDQCSKDNYNGEEQSESGYMEP